MKMSDDHYLTNKAYFSVIAEKNIYASCTHKMATKASWHRHYATVTLCIAMSAEDDRTTASDNCVKFGNAVSEIDDQSDGHTHRGTRHLSLCQTISSLL